MRKESIKDLLNSKEVNREVEVKGWVKTKRGNKHVGFIALNDGSTIHNIQIVAELEELGENALDKVNTGAAIGVKGMLIESTGSGQQVEVKAIKIDVIGEANPEEYPIQPKKHSMEFLRENAHLRFRTNTFSAVMRIRHAMSFAIHKYFNDNGFYYLHTPIITASDAEGAGETFKVTTLNLANLPKNDEGNIDYKSDFFGKETNLTVSGQLEAETGALSLSKVYTFGPTFRAENSNTTRHLAEFWMIEPEIAFANITDDMDLVEDILKYLFKYALKNCADDLAFLDNRIVEEEKNLPQDKRSPMGLIEKLKFVIENDFERISYTDAFQILRNSKPNKKKKFEYLIDTWGADLQSEHERYLVEKHFKKPVIIFDYPKDIKAFYMKQNDDGKTVAAMDVLAPGIGEIVGGSERETDLQKLKNRMQEMNIPEEELWWYLDLRRFGSCPHAGFGLGFERLILFVTGMSNIRDVIPFPRTPKNAEF